MRLVLVALLPFCCGAALWPASLACARELPTQAELVERGRQLFTQRCAMCHGAGAGVGQGPSLGGVVGRKAGSTRFGYTAALRSAKLTWDRGTLDAFLAAPGKLVPGTAMPIPLPNDGERRAVIAYLATLPAAASSGTNSEVVRLKPEDRGAFADYRGDGPGVHHHLTVADLPAPFATGSARNGPEIVAPPPGAHPDLPPGFQADVFAHDLAGPRLLRVSPSGDLFVAESQAGRIRVLRAPDGAHHAAEDQVFAAKLERPFGIAFYPPGPAPLWVYVAETNAVVRFPYRNGDLLARGKAETVVPSLTRTLAGHWTRDVAFSRDGKQMLVSVGSGSNVAQGETDEHDRADVLVFDPEGHDRRIFASGIRNCVGLAIHPSTGDVWCSTNERDGLGDDLVPDYVTRVKQGGFYGWPWFYLGGHPDPRHEGEHPELASQVLVPDVLVQSHSAPLQMVFYEASTFPERYQHGAFVALHGSWNRARRIGPKVVFVPVRSGVPSGDYEDFMTDFVVNEDAVWARPVGVAVAHDGALFVSEDGNGTLWRVSFGGDAATPPP